MSTLLITGGAGFIGSNFVAHALEHLSDRLVIVDKLTYAGSLLNVEAALKHSRVAFVRADIADRDAMAQIFTEHHPDAVVNLAAETHVDRSIDSASPFVQTNLVGTFVLLETARIHLRSADEHRRRAFRFLHVSTDEVYGTLGPTGQFDEETAYAPNSPYAATKAGADHLVRAYYHTYSVPTIITNCSNNYGPFQFPEKLIPLMILNAIDGRDLPVYGDGGNVRDWLHVEDHCEGIAAALRMGRAGEKYNIGGASERTNLQVVQGVCGALERRMPARANPALAARGFTSYADLVRFVPDRPGHDRRYAIDASKIGRDLRWSPRHTFESGLDDTVAWYVSHRDWCDAVQQGRYDRERLGLG